MSPLGAIPGARNGAAPGHPLPFALPSGVPTLERILFHHHYNMVGDPRLETWVEAIDAIPEGSVVADFGCGTGILSMLAARRASRVYAVEIDDDLFEYARGAAHLNGLSDRMVLLHGDAREVELPEPVDVVICEMLDTGLICEMQAEVIPRVARFLRPGGRVIPRRVETLLEPVFTDYQFFGIRLPLPFFETTEARKAQGGFARPSLCHEALFDGRAIPLDVSASVDFAFARDGMVNSFRMTSVTEVAPGLSIPGSHWLNPPLVFPFEPVEVRAGGTLTLHVSYRLSGGLRTVDYRVE